MGSVFKKAITVFLVQAAMLLATAGMESSRAQAGDLTTSETIIDYARSGLTAALGDDYRLKPGTIEIEDEAGVDIGNAFRSMVGAEAKKYQVRFVAIDRAGEAYRGHIKMVVNAISSLGEDKEDDNNTTLRGSDQGTGRMIKIQLVSYLHRSQPITPKQMYLVRISK
ncbi:MAG: hypothetical protein U1E10_11710 [Bdellovibrionales bacterium]|nr:hypothetical protein [Bdellovibrionales bacterium]